MTITFATTRFFYTLQPSGKRNLRLHMPDFSSKCHGLPWNSDDDCN